MKSKRSVIFSQDELRHTVEERIRGANDVRDDRLGALLSLSGVREKLQRSELQRLTNKYGAGHQRVAETEALASTTAVRMRALYLEIERTGINPPQGSRDKYVVFGVVRDTNDKILDDVFVRLVDEKGEPVTKDLESTDGHGVFRITYPIAPAQAKAKASAKEDDTKSQLIVRIEVLSAKGKQLALDPVELRPLPGMVEYRQIVVSARPPKKTATRGK